KLLTKVKNASLLNFARHEVVDHKAILEALENRSLKNFITDFPTPQLIKRANDKGDVILLPHIGASTLQAEENCAVMAVDQIRDFLENGNITNSVNFPNVSLPQATSYRITITNKNVPAMIGQIATSLGDLGLNISDMTNVSRGDLAYNLIDIENEVTKEALEKLSAIENIINVRLITKSS
nr:3-phosphoglycerate dehydrogenase [SAR86 cluster bacterium]